MTVIETKNLKKSYGNVQALKGADLCVEEGSIFGFLGPNGAGKTTMIKILTGLIPSTSGSCRVNGYSTGNATSDHRKHIGYLSQKPSYYSWMTGEELLNFVGSLFGMNSSDCKRRTAELLEISGLGKAGFRRIGGYSGGMVQRLGIAQAIYHKPKVVFLDEPVSALDPVGRRDVLQFIGKLKEFSTVFMSTHILADVERVCDEVAIIKEGLVLLQEKTSTLLRKHSTGMFTLTFATPQDSLGLKDFLLSKQIKVNQDASVLRINRQEFIDNRDIVLAKIATEHLDLLGIQEDSSSLEDVFMNIVEKGDYHG
jgi:ABC-2 type transport system ATP-binding protein